MANPAAIVVHALAQETLPGQTAQVDLGAVATDATVYRSACRLSLELTSITAPATTQVGGGPAVTFTGIPSDPENTFYLQIQVGGAIGVATFRWSKDGGQTFEEQSADVAADVALGDTGITALFAAGTYEANTTYSWAFRIKVTIDASGDGVTGWRPVDSFPALADTALIERAFIAGSRFVRARWELSAASATFRVSGEAHQIFFAESDITSGEVPAEAIAGIAKHVIADGIIKGSGDIEDALNSAYKPPILAVPESIRQRGGAIAAFHALKHRGLQPEGPNELVIDAKKAAEKWLMRVSQGNLKPPGIVDSTPTRFEGGAVVRSSPRRGW